MKKRREKNGRKAIKIRMITKYCATIDELKILNFNWTTMLSVKKSVFLENISILVITIISFINNFQLNAHDDSSRCCWYIWIYLEIDYVYGFFVACSLSLSPSFSSTFFYSYSIFDLFTRKSSILSLIVVYWFHHF